MKKLAVVLAMLISVTSYSQVSRATLVASGLTCSMCSKSIYEALKKVETVENVKANIKESSYNIVFKKDQAISFDDIRKAVEDAGFSVSKLQVAISFDKVEIKNDAHVSIDGINLHFLHVQPQTLTGETTVTLLDKNFESSKEHKKHLQYTAMKCFVTGTMEPCCNSGSVVNERIYHVTI